MQIGDFPFMLCPLNSRFLSILCDFHHVILHYLKKSRFCIDFCSDDYSWNIWSVEMHKNSEIGSAIFAVTATEASWDLALRHK